MKAYAVRDARGVTLATEEHVEVALRKMNRIDAAESVARLDDGVVIATKFRLKGDSFWWAIWNYEKGLS